MLVPLHPLYPLLFAAHGLSDAEISSLFVVWALTTLLVEVPSGAWADAWSRRGLLALSAVLEAVAFGAWVLLPSYGVFAAGFVVWGVASAMDSGTLEALVHDELERRGEGGRFATLMGRARAGGLLAALMAGLIAAPLSALGGYGLVGTASVLACLTTAALARSLPEPPVPEPGSAEGPPPDGSADDPTDDPIAGWSAMLRDGVREVRRDPVVRRAVLIAAAVAGLVAADEYLPLLLEDRGAGAGLVAVLTGVIGLAEAVGAGLAGRVGHHRAAWLAAGTAVLLAVGSLVPLVPAVVALALGYGLAQALLVLVDTAVQETVTGAARATVTSLSGLGAETVAIAVFAAVGLGSVWFALPVVLAATALPLLAVAGRLRRR